MSGTEPPGICKGLPKLLSRWEFHGVTYVLVTLSSDDDDCITMKWMPEGAYRKWSARQARKARG